MTHKELYSICHDEAVAYANLEQWSKRTGEEKSFLIQGYLDAMMEMRKSEITEMKKEYPKTYEECCEVLSLGEDSRLYTKGYKASLIQDFQKLRICRDAYWKIAGEEMGLGRPWEPDWNNQESSKYCIAYVESQIKTAERYIINTILAFPTEEMRDAFYENFKKEIEICKELL